MQIREYSLPIGWFPRDPDEISRVISGYPGQDGQEGLSRAVIAPHAGWYYCGHLMALSCASLDRGAETIAVIGGHLPSGYPALFAMEDAARTPFGAMPVDKELRVELQKELDKCRRPWAHDKYKDNTVEVLLPMVRYFFPKAELLWLRLPCEIASFKTGKLLSETAARLGKKINVIGSTDLTHYGRNYGFSPHGSGEAALRWVRNVNDAAFIKAVESFNHDEVLRCAQQDSSSCSAGAVLGAMGFAGSGADIGAGGGAKLLKYSTSADMDDRVPDSFVGYASIIFTQRR